jgi:hypothetical protein
MRTTLLLLIVLVALTSCDGDRVRPDVPPPQTESSVAAASASPSTILSHEQYPDFSTLPLSQQVRSSSAIVVGRMVGEPPTCLVAEVLKVEEDKGQFVVGQALPLCKQPNDPTYLRQEAQLHFYAGKPTTLRYSVSVYEGHVPAMRGQRFQRVREEILAEAKR